MAHNSQPKVGLGRPRNLRIDGLKILPSDVPHLELSLFINFL